MENTKGNDIRCMNCGKIYGDRLGYDLHRWEEHPSDKYQIIWSKLAKAGWPGNHNFNYKENPYY